MKFIKKLKTRGLYGALFERIALSKLNFKFLFLLFFIFQLLFLAFFSLGWSIFKQTTVENKVSQDMNMLHHISVMSGKEMFQLGEVSYELKNLIATELADRKNFSQLKKDLEDKFLFLAKTNSFFDQVRLFDAEGNEIIRVENRKDSQTLIPDELLQAKGDRPYFDLAFSLRPDEYLLYGPVPMSEEGRVIFPARTVIQSFFPIENPKTQERFGYININLDTDHLFGEIQESMGIVSGAAHIVGPDGNWLFMKQNSNGFENYVGRGLSFKNSLPDLWTKIQAQREGQFLDGENPVIFKKIMVFPDVTIPNFKSMEISLNPETQKFVEGFYLISIITPPKLSTLFKSAPATVYTVWGGYLLFTMILSFYITYLVAIRASMKERTRHSLKMEAVGELTGGVAHDFNNLLTAIIGNLGFLERGKNSAAEKEMIQQSLKAAWRGAELTKRLLAFSRKSHLAPKELDLCQILKEMKPLILTTIGENIILSLDFAEEKLLVSVDPLEYENVVLNLAINARDAMKKGGNLDISVYPDAFNKEEAAAMEIPPGHYIVTKITDSGEGMSLEVQKQAIDPFFTTKPIGEGSGLGLSMAYGFAKQSEGELKIISEVGKGTTILIILPAAKTA